MNKIYPKDIDKISIHSRCISKGRYEVNGVIIYADTMSESIRKYIRAKDESGT